MAACVLCLTSFSWPHGPASVGLEFNQCSLNLQAGPSWDIPHGGDPPFSLNFVPFPPIHLKGLSVPLALG